MTTAPHLGIAFNGLFSETIGKTFNPQDHLATKVYEQGVHIRVTVVGNLDVWLTDEELRLEWRLMDKCKAKNTIQFVDSREWTLEDGVQVRDSIIQRAH